MILHPFLTLFCFVTRYILDWFKDLIDAILSQTPKQEGIGVDPKGNPNFRFCFEKHDYFFVCTGGNFLKHKIQELVLCRHLEMPAEQRPETFR